MVETNVTIEATSVIPNGFGEADLIWQEQRRQDCGELVIVMREMNREGFCGFADVIDSLDKRVAALVRIGEQFNIGFVVVLGDDGVKAFGIVRISVARDFYANTPVRTEIGDEREGVVGERYNYCCFLKESTMFGCDDIFVLIRKDQVIETSC